MSTTAIHAVTTRRQAMKPARRQHNRRFASTALRLGGYIQALGNRRRLLANMTAIYRDQTIIYPLQVEATLSRLIELRCVVLAARAYLTRWEPAETERFRPYACITKLGSLDYLLTEVLLNVTMFADVCQAISPDRVHLHMTIRAAFPALLTAYDDLLSQLTALVDKARQQPTGTDQGEEARA